MKKYVAAMLMTLMSVSALAGPATRTGGPNEDWEYVEHNWTVGYDKTGTSLNARTESGSDYWHVEVGQKVGKFEVLYRYAETDVDTTENRVTGRFALWSNESWGLSVTPEVAYKFLENEDNYTRLSVIVEARKEVPFICNTEVFVRLKPRWYTGKQHQDEDFRTDDGRYQAGLDYKFGKVTVGGFVEYNALTGFDKDRWMTGTRVAYNF